LIEADTLQMISIKSKIEKRMYPTPQLVYMCTYCRTWLKNSLGVSWYHLKWLHWHNFLTVERCQVSALLNTQVAHVLLSFSVDGQLNML